MIFIQEGKKGRKERRKEGRKEDKSVYISSQRYGIIMSFVGYSFK